MKFSPLALVSALAAQPALSFLLVPTIPKLDGSSIENPPPTAEQVIVNLKCAQCPFPEVHNDKVDLGKGVDSVLPIKFTSYKGTFLMNDKQIYPHPPASNPALLTGALQRLSDNEESQLLSFGYVFETLPSPYNLRDKSGSYLLNFRLTVVDINGIPIDMEPVNFRVIRTPGPEPEMVFAQVDIEPAPIGRNGLGMPENWEVCDGNRLCYRKLLYARIHGIFASAKQRATQLAGGVKGCMGKMHDRISTFFAGLRGNKHHNHHGHGGGENQTETVPVQPIGFAEPPTYYPNRLDSVAHTVRDVIVPAFIGIATGFITAAAIYLVIVTVITAYRAIKTRRAARREAGNDEEHEPLVYGKDAEEHEEMDAPPRYEEDAQPLSGIVIDEKANE